MEELSFARESDKFQLWAYCLMPNHVHLQIYPYQEKYNMSKIMQSIKGKMSLRYHNFLLEQNSELYAKMCIQTGKKRVFRFWQSGGGFDRNLWNEKAIYASVEYIEANPVRAGLAESPEDWHWSSARVRNTGDGILPDIDELPF